MVERRMTGDIANRGGHDGPLIRPIRCSHHLNNMDVRPAELQITPKPLERIAVDWNREAVAIDRVNPLDLDSVDQIHVVGGSPQAIPTEHDLV